MEPAQQLDGLEAQPFKEVFWRVQCRHYFGLSEPASMEQYLTLENVSRQAKFNCPFLVVGQLVVELPLVFWQKDLRPGASR